MTNGQRDIAIVLIILLTVISVLFIWHLPQPAAPSEVAQTNTSPTAGWTPYTQGDFSLKYAPSMILTHGDSPDFPSGSLLVPAAGADGTSSVLMSVSIPRDAYPGTNFVAGWLTVSTDASPTSQARCGQYMYGTTPTAFSQRRVSNGIEWAYDRTGEGAAGTDFETHVSHTLHNGTCYEIAEHEAESNIGNFDPGTVTAIDPTSVFDQLDNVFTTFAFTK